MEAQLVIIEGHQKGRIFTCRGHTAIGRDPSNDLQILDSKTSRKHAVLFERDGRWFIKDLESRNGTWLNNERISERELNNGDIVYIGDTILEVRLKETRRGQSPPGESATASRPSQGSTVSLHQVRRGDNEASLTVRLSNDKESFATSRFKISPDHLLKEEREATIESLRNTNRKLRKVYEINRALSSLMSLEKVLDRILDILFEILPAQRGVILLYDEEGGGYRPTSARIRQGDESVQQGSIEVSTTILNIVTEERMALLSTDVGSDARIDPSKSIVAQNIKSCLCVPLIFQDKLLGAIYLDNTSMTSSFSEEDLEILTGVASQAAVSIENARLLERIEREITIRSNLSRYLPAELMEQVVNDEMSFDTEGQLKKATVMFTDIRGYTSMSEKETPQTIVKMLNEYFEIMVDIIMKHGGAVDKFIGDAIMAVWGVPHEKEDDALRAVKAAIKMQQALEVYNTERERNGLPPIHMGVAINTGEVVAGNVGSPQRMQYTVIGDNVNLASRLEGLTKAGEILISESTYREASSHVRAVSAGTVQVKGRNEPVSIYKVEGMLDDSPKQVLRSYRRLKLVRKCKLVHGPSRHAFTAVLCDVSRGGAGLQAMRKDVSAMGVGDEMILALPGMNRGGDSPFLVKGRLVRIEQASSEADLCIVGMKFEDEEAAVGRFLEALSRHGAE